MLSIRLLSLIAVTGLLTGCATTVSPARMVPADRYRVEVGDSPVGIIPGVLLRDSARDKDLEVNIEYPTRGDRHPLIIFSHGFGGSSSSYVGLSSYWTSQGYVVIKPTHADSRRVSRGTVASEGPEQWRNRALDITLILDSIPALESRYRELAGKIDMTRIGVGGHSYGALTAMLMGGVTTFPGRVSYGDPRIKAVAALSPQGPAGRWGLTDESWTNVRLPTLYMTGTLDRGMEDSEDPSWRQAAYDLAPPGDQWLVIVEGARHASFTGRIDYVMQDRLRRLGEDGTFRPTPEEQVSARYGRGDVLVEREKAVFAAIRSLSLAFWDVYLRDEAAGRRTLEQGERALVRQK